jgi:D-glycero-D-manno-heptose 1,7-bisphosphate phosphatase
MASSTTCRRAVFLDRDGTINRDVGFTHRVEDLELLPGAAEGLARIAALGYRLLITTNQSGIARGLYSEAEMQAFNAALLERLRAAGVTIDAIYFCPYHPTAGVGQYRRESPLRKPGDGMIRLAAAEHQLDLPTSFVVGDKKSDVVAGQRAGCGTILVRTGAGGSDDEPLSMPPDFVADDLRAAAEYIERAPRQRPPSPSGTPEPPMPPRSSP